MHKQNNKNNLKTINIRYVEYFLQYFFAGQNHNCIKVVVPKYFILATIHQSKYLLLRRDIYAQCCSPVQG